MTPGPAPSDTGSVIDSLTARLRTDFDLHPVVAAEIEFYLPGAAESGNLESFWETLGVACAESGIRMLNAGPETGRDQYEISLRTGSDAKKAAADTVKLKSLVMTLAPLCGFVADFGAKPFAAEPGSGLHMHLSLNNACGRNTFYKNDSDISPELSHSIGGILAWIGDCMPVFAPSPASYARFQPRSNAPLTASWGANNRTTAVRLPDAPHHDKHIELRVSGADADPRLVMAVMLAAVHYGLKHGSDPGPQMYGDASLPDCALPRLPATLEEAAARLQTSRKILEYFTPATLLAA